MFSLLRMLNQQSSVQKDSRTTSSTEPTQRNTENHKEDSEIKEKDREELDIEENDEESEDGFDEIAGQLQGMKVVLENMKHDYETRLKEMQEKIAALEKERAQITEKVSQPTSTAEAPIAGTEEIRMKKEEYDAVVGKTQEMESSPENMETNYDSRLKNIQETYNTRLEEVQQKVAITPQFERPKLYVDHTSKRFPSGSNRKNALPPHVWSLILPTFIPLSNKHCHVSSARST